MPLHDSFMQWLDGQTGDISTPGNLRGPCSTTSGHPADIMANNADAAVTWSNIKYGEIGTTF
jgi:cellulose 1,4-beta-cellobiosidase